MTTLEITTECTTIQNPADVAAELMLLVGQARANVAGTPAPTAVTRVRVRQSVSDWQAAIAQAQRVGDFAYDWVMDHTGDGEQAAVEYHLEYQTVTRELGCGPVCGCDLCREQFGEGAQ